AGLVRQPLTTFSENLKKFVAFHIFNVSFANHCQNWLFYKKHKFVNWPLKVHFFLSLLIGSFL
ncbi:MAG: hypothetical protein WCG32_05985, partial [Actinomycetes bacterium]